MTVSRFQRKILSWAKENRRDLPWRNTWNPYEILVSEVMLQQTQISRVLPKYEEFIQTFPNAEALARAKEGELFSVWKGLGYWRRATYLKQTTAIVVNEHEGVFPRDPKILERFPGIGHYTARALACFSFQCKEAFLDTNIRRTYLHFFFPGKEGVPDKEVLEIAQQAVWKEDPREWHYALFDYGAAVLKDKSINKRSRHYAKQSRFEGSFRFFRTKVMRFLLDQPDQAASAARIARVLKESESPYSMEKLLSSLLQDELIKKKEGKYSL